MPERTLSPLPLGMSDFESMRAQGTVYVDKTDLAVQLAAPVAKKVFLTRPRRFGKSLLVSTFESIFKHGTRDFKGLAAEKLWRDTTYTVIRLDFSEAAMFSSIDEFRQRLLEVCLNGFMPCGFVYRPDATVDRLSQWGAWLKAQDAQSLVVLIDEYDAPLTSHLGQAILPEIAGELSKFYEVLSQSQDRLRFLFVTGIVKFHELSLFTKFDDLEDVSFDPIYGTLTGFAEEELQQFFGLHLDSALEPMHLPDRSTLIDRLRRMYGGFCFDSSAQTQVYAPWSILNFLTKPQEGLLPYWFESGGLSTVKHILVADAAFDPESPCVTLPLSRLRQGQSTQSIDTVLLLTQTGYFTIQQAQGDGQVKVGYPNHEVAISVERVLMYEHSLYLNKKGGLS